MELFADKVGAGAGAEAGAETPDETEAMEWGNRLEPLIAEAYSDQTGHRVERCRYRIDRSARYPWMICSPDGFIPSLGALFEAKTAGGHNLSDWQDEPPLAYLVQAQHSLEVLGLDLCILAVLIGGQTFRHYEIRRERTFLDQLLPREEAFWRCVETRIPPAIDGSEATKRALQALYPREKPGTQAVLPVEAAEWDAKRLEAQAQVKHWQTELGYYDNLLRHAIGSAESAVLINGVTYTYRASERKGYVVEPMTVRTLRRREAK
jgi:predicted phage-related endonuclease